jgi:hypothetical protein
LQNPSADNGWTGWKSFYGNANGIPGDPSVTCLDYFSTQQSNVWNLASEMIVTMAPTMAPTLAPSASPASAKGDPHLQNIGGERFDLMQPGWHVMVHIPRGADTLHTFFHVLADAQRAGPMCGDLYFKNLEISGAWVESKHNGTLQFRAQDVGGEMESRWMTFGSVDVKVVRGHTQEGMRYFNLYIKRLGSTRFKVGGLLGEDDHESEASPSNDCLHLMRLTSIGNTRLP